MKPFRRLTETMSDRWWTVTLASGSAYAFPTEVAAQTFADNHGGVVAEPTGVER
jgi:hypothetical protein